MKRGKAQSLPDVPGAASGQAVVDELVRLYDGRRADVRRIAEQAGRLWELAELAKARLAVEGHFVDGRYGLVCHPAVTLEKEARMAFVTCVRALRQRPPREKTGRLSSTEHVAANAPQAKHRYIRSA